MLDGKKTYIGIALMVISMFGLTKYITPAEAESMINLIVGLVGIGVSVYGRYSAK